MSAVLEQSGVRLERKRADLLPAGTKIRLLRDRLLLKVLDWQPSTVLTTVYHGKPLRGLVVALGPGYRQKKRRYNARGECISESETGRIRPMEVKLGEIVEVGGLELRGYDFPQFFIGNELHILCQEEDVAGVVE